MLNYFTNNRYKLNTLEKIWKVISALITIILTAILISIIYMGFISKNSKIVLVTGVSSEPVIPNYSLVVVNKYNPEDYHIGDFLMTEKGMTITHICWKIDKKNGEYGFYTAALDFMVTYDRNLSKPNTFRYIEQDKDKIGDRDLLIEAKVDYDGQYGVHQFPLNVLLSYDYLGDSWEENQQILRDGRSNQIVVLNSSTTNNQIDSVLGEARKANEVVGKVDLIMAMTGKLIQFIRYQGNATLSILFVIDLFLAFAVFKTDLQYYTLSVKDYNERMF